MKARKWRLVGLMLVLAALAAWLWRSHPGEPRYAGTPLSVWFKVYCFSGNWMQYDEAKREEAATALRQIGTNAVPFLVRKAFDTDQESSRRTNFYGVVNPLLRSLKFPPLVPTGVMSIEAPEALREIKPPAALLLPLVAAQLNSTDDLLRAQALVILGAASDGAEAVVPFLAKAALEDSDPWNRRIAIGSLDSLGPQASGAVPILLEIAQAPANGSNHLANAAAWALGNIRSNAAPALPLLGQMFEQETNWNTRCGYAAALLKIDADQTAALSFLVDGLTTHPADFTPASLLGQIGTNAQPAAPALLAVLQHNTNQMPWVFAVMALEKIGAPKEAYLPVIKERLNTIDETMRATVAQRVLLLDPTDPKAQSTLINMVKKRSIFSVFAINELGRAGPAAREATPVLTEALQSDDRAVRTAAALALKKIQAGNAAK